MSTSGSLQTIGELFGYLGSALGVAMVLPQIARTLRHRRLGGVAPLSWALTALACTSWFLYGIRSHEIVQIPGNIMLVTGGVVVTLLVPARISVLRRAAVLGTGMTALVLIAVVTPPTTPGNIAFGIGIVSALPQLRASFRRSFDGPSAVSIPTWVMRCCSQGAWLAFSIMTGDHVVLTSAIWTMTVNIAVLTAELRRARLTAAHAADDTAPLPAVGVA